MKRLVIAIVVVILVVIVLALASGGHHKQAPGSGLSRVPSTSFALLR